MGETVLLCGHVNRESPRGHFFKYPEGVCFERFDPEGRDERSAPTATGVAHWLVVCDDCYRDSGRDPHKITVTGHATWLGDAPAILEREDPS